MKRRLVITGRRGTNIAAADVNLTDEEIGGDRRKEYLPAGVSNGSPNKGARMKIGFIGLGIMGGRMAANLQKHSYSLAVFNRTRAKAEPLLGPCGTFSDSQQKSPNRWTSCSRCWRIRARSKKQLWAATDS